ncbi:MAG: biopolymer transporter ExbD [Myxococcales bacterium]|nr:biopolymer transporter ExbD [Myxococcales bacterium]
MAFGSGKGGGLNSDINVTPMVDVMLVLLVIFMVTAPMLNTAVDLELPPAAAKVVELDDGKLVLRIDRQRQLFLGDTKVAWSELEQKLTTNERLRRESELFIEADRKLLYEDVMFVMALAQQAGVAKVMLLTGPPEEPGAATGATTSGPATGGGR